MRAMVLKAFGGPENFELADIAIPSPKAGEVLVKIHASALNPVDVRIRAGLPIGPALPALLGADLAGTVASVGAGVAGLAPGDDVYGCAGGVRNLGGTFAEYIAADARLLAPKPRNLSMHEAAERAYLFVKAFMHYQDTLGWDWSCYHLAADVRDPRNLDGEIPVHWIAIITYFKRDGEFRIPGVSAFDTGQLVNIDIEAGIVDWSEESP